MASCHLLTPSSSIASPLTTLVGDEQQDISMDLGNPTEAALHRLNEAEHPEIAPHTCAFCQKMVIGVDHAKQQFQFDDSRQEQAGLVTLADCIQAAQDGCAFCSFLVSADLARSAQRRRPYVSLQSNQIFWTTRIHDAPQGPLLYVSHGQSREHDGREKLMAFGESMGKFQLYTVPEQLRSTLPLANTITHSECEKLLNSYLPPNLVPDSQLSHIRARAWLDECGTTHLKCREYQKHFKPKRLLEIANGGKRVSIRSEQPTTVCYATLSYCWGGDQPVKATRSTIEALHQPFGTEKLPAGIQDGIKIAFALGFRFLWVDALCIIQDDPRDVAEQISQMHQIYTGSALTIAASSASAVSEGFLQPRHSWRPTILTARTDFGEHFPILAVPEYEHQVYENPLFTRAWAYQENQISARILSFGLQTTAFFCLESEHQDGGNYRLECERNARGCANVGFLDAGMRSLDTATHPKAWNQVVDTYTRLGLSSPSDKLPALAAMAEEYSRRMPVTEYLAGLWTEDLLHQLLWTSILEAASRPPVYCGPSWSWCSIVGRVEFLHNYKDVSELSFLCSVKAAETRLSSGGYAFGHVDGGSLILSGRVRTLIWMNRPELRPNKHARSVEGSHSYLSVKDGLDCDSRLDVSIDAPSEWPHDGDVPLSAIEVCRYRDEFSEEYDDTHTRALLLQRMDDGRKDGSVYRRVGMLFASHQTTKQENWFDEWSTRMDVTIV